MPQPMQSVIVDEDGVVRFKRNEIVDYLLRAGPDDMMNHLARLNFPREDREQFAQLIGYSVSGFSELSYASPKMIAAAEAAAEVAREKDLRV